MLLPGLIALALGAQDAPLYRHSAGSEPRALVVLAAAPESSDKEWENWRQIAATRQWHAMMPSFSPAGDGGVKSIEAMIESARRKPGLEKAAFYLIGAGPAAASVFYIAARAPYLWSAALAIGGTPKPAIDSDRLYAANTTLLPVGWAVSPEDKQATAAPRQKLITAGYNLHLMESPAIDTALDFLAKHLYSEFPRQIDCETGSPQVARCYWITPTDFDPSLRNDAIRSTRVPAEVYGSLDLGGFGYKPDAPGPGVLVEFLPPKYEGPLQLQDRIVALSGKPIADARHYLELMSQVTEERPVQVTIERLVEKKKERIRVLSRYQLPRRQEVITARLQAHYNPEAREIVIISRTVAALDITVPPHWVPSTINWNGDLAASPENAGCYHLSKKEPGNAKPCEKRQKE